MVEDLIKRLRDTVDEEAGHGVRNEAADLIEQQATRITESESHRNDLADKIVEQKTEIGALKARITALESERDALLAAAGKEAVAIYQVRQKGSLKWQDLEAISLNMFADEEKYQIRTVYTAPTAALEKGDGRDAWQPIETAPEGKLVVVAWLDKDDPENPERHAFDFIEDDGWVKHNEDYDHFCCVAPPGSTGPSADAPYTHWLLIPELPEAPANQKQAG
jgi:hypothetical protein